MSDPTPRLGEDRLDEIAQLCRRTLTDGPSAEELAGALFSDDQPAVVHGDPARGVVATVECDDGPHIRLLLVDESARGRGVGRSLLEVAERWAREAGHRVLITGADPPYFLWPGAPSGETGLLCLLERRHYHRIDTNFNMDVDLTALADDPGGHELAGADDYDEVDEWMSTHWSNWRPEVLRALGKGNLVIARGEGREGGVTAFCAFEVNRRGLLGPVAVRPDLMGRGMGKGVLNGALHELRARGAEKVSVVWVGPIVPYALVGGKVTDVYFVYRKQLS
ncbi:MAG TPA: GNAT family N-acetyltransferase [Acidimicrobiales bacterium]|jgi:GNAT superfamily N-acetyltransferase|nr:GNAT family N-acetyltransferase [Acidimicrobiales bacterium]